jgi:diguanylate cyclase (GGDEF)-like protein
MYFAGNARSTFVVLGIAMFAFGIFQFKLREFIILGAYILFGYAALILLLYFKHSQNFDLKFEITVWFATCIALFQFGFLANTISNLKQKLKIKLSELASQNIELNKALHKINEMATHDELTGVYNRRFLIEKIASEASRCKRNGSTFSLCMVDIDLFKKVNDTYGHPIGDEVLRRVASVASSSLRDIDIFGRIGGEEFLMILADTNENGAMITAERIRKEIAKINLSDINDQLYITASLGVAEHHTGSDPIDTLKLADSALYSAKGNGRNQTSGFQKIKE